ncbi:PH domain-containing protein [Fictibacillus phosphorivorans]|uniref:PH domain-containing protein n=1 Tax=Fictibacillus phosphorivorans TaxID=1221500 RepID=UPI00204264CE|nr:PH domain-containing protein [Fictibacillus phosphorivorans]MCM3719247.1 PH domain-containing protein [Fictibacillus phosphorivorans]MCM3776869.1 PH domain-containing protein [Fictibacillus phosphorivorans]
MKFPSKRDVWLGLILLISIGYGSFVSFSALLSENADLVESLFTLALNLVIILFICWLWFSTYYVLDEKELVIRCGPINKRIPYHEIQSAHKTWNPLSSPALSLKRINIKYQFGMALISPKDRDKFLRLLKERCPQADIKFD